MRISDWSSDVCSSDLCPFQGTIAKALQPGPRPEQHERPQEENESVDLNAAEPTVETGSIAVEQRRQDDARAHIVSESCRSGERSVGKEGVSTCRSRWSTCH